MNICQCERCGHEACRKCVESGNLERGVMPLCCRCNDLEAGVEVRVQLSKSPENVSAASSLARVLGSG